jgi:diguanylate cyclase
MRLSKCLVANVKKVKATFVATLKTFLKNRQSVMQSRLHDEGRMARLLSAIAAVIAIFVSLAAPASYFVLTSEAETRESKVEARLHAAFVSIAINNSFGDWRTQVAGLISADLNLTQLPELRLIVDRNGVEVDRAGAPISGLFISAKAPIESAQGTVGYVVVRRSIEPIILKSALVFVFSLALGFVIYVVLKTVPLRALKKTLEALKSSEATARKDAEKNLRVVFENAPDGILMCAPSGLIQSCNPSTTKLLGYSENELKNMFLSDLLHGTSPTKDLKRVTAIQCEAIMRRRNGDSVAVDVTVSDSETLGVHHTPANRIAIVRDMTEKQVIQKQLANIANYDGLTGLANRSLFRNRLQSAIEKCDDSSQNFVLMFLDLDRFKTINDSLGHEFGDRLLQLVASELASCLRENDFVCRYSDQTNDVGVYRLGGDEFTVLIENIPNRDVIESIAKRLLVTLAQPFHVGIHQLFISASIGITVYPQEDTTVDLEALIKQADLAMYRSKALGRDTFSFFTSELQLVAKEQHQLENNLRHALERGEYRLVYQPKANLATGKIVGVEALLRWHPPGGTVVGPDRFIPILEESGLIIPVGMWVLRTACEQLSAWVSQGLAEFTDFTDFTMAVNLSARQFRQSDLLEQIANVLHETNVPAGRLEIELTESSIVEDTDEVLKIMQGLRDLNVRVAIDDFGTGHSSLRYLKQFSIDTLKIDRSFVRDIPHDPEDNAIAIAVIALGRAMGLKVVAEGVETMEQAQFLREHQCDEMQGYLLSKPIDASALQTWYVQRDSAAIA